MGMAAMARWDRWSEPLWRLSGGALGGVLAAHGTHPWTRAPKPRHGMAWAAPASLPGTHGSAIQHPLSPPRDCTTATRFPAVSLSTRARASVGQSMVVKCPLIDLLWSTASRLAGNPNSAPPHPTQPSSTQPKLEPNWNPTQSEPSPTFCSPNQTEQYSTIPSSRVAIDALLLERNQKEELLVFNADDYPDVHAMVALGRRVRLMVGVHGGAMYNLIFMQPGTGLVEVCPVAQNEESSRCGLVFWEMAGVRNMPYWSVIATNTTAHWDIMHMDCGLVVSAVRHALEGLPTVPSPLEAFHQGTRFRRQLRRSRAG
jgi:hypothetical protein